MVVRFLELVGFCTLAAGMIALLNWGMGEKHLLFNNARKTVQVLKKIFKRH